MSLLPLGLLSQGGGASGSDYELISTQVLGSNTSTITISSIPSTFTHLQLRIAMRDNAGGTVPVMRFNGDTGANYSWHTLGSNGSATNLSVGASQTSIRLTIAHWGTSGTFPTAQIIDLMEYKSADTFKTARIFSGQAGSSANELSLMSGNWRSTSAITSITLTGMTFATGSRFSIYGIKG
jgi:hypothetical protein